MIAAKDPEGAVKAMEIHLVDITDFSKNNYQ